MVSRSRLALLCLSFAAACSSPPPREYYVPLGLPVAPQLQVCGERAAGWRFELRCQGTYLNTVGGLPRRTLHLQFDVWRPSSRPLGLPLDEVLVTLAGSDDGPDLDPPSRLPLTEAWSGVQPVTGEVIVEPWSLRTFDLFFDDPDLLRPPADTVRVRWRHRGDGAGPTYHECAFQRIAGDHPLRPADRAPADRAFGYADGWYMPGLGSLGPRALVQSQEQRSHYVFHSP